MDNDESLSWHGNKEERNIVLIAKKEDDRSRVRPTNKREWKKCQNQASSRLKTLRRKQEEDSRILDVCKLGKGSSRFTLGLLVHLLLRYS